MKLQESCEKANDMLSPPSRGAWIEIAIAAEVVPVGGVAPLAGGVD